MSNEEEHVCGGKAGREGRAAWLELEGAGKVGARAALSLILTLLSIPRVSGLSPFMGDNDNETLANVTSATWDFDDEAFDEISEDAKDFISSLLKKDMK